ncbi:mannitol dehydrogenase family protein [Alteromonas sp. a30]|uniref:mannitol dehydrogenase family protein n=1 Tax=Alteromonas sp. a30 TaxID=2730917 RepID=UPI0022814BA4|nr:mannitol dehydrogenase family protein [Alteromonas sp. a30]MCY7296718.1 mannitol dehydrogenase family protein [Alteromonas sp. a30]
MKLNRKNLPYIAQQQVAVPQYNAPTNKPAIVHIGVGGFHRAHMARYCDQLLNNNAETEWHICGVGVMPQDKVLQEKLLGQDCLYSLMELSATPRVSVIGAISDFILAPENPESVVAKLSEPTTKIVSLTITEGGYPYNRATQTLMRNNPDVAHDLAHPTQPKTAFGYILYGLMQRMQKGLNGFTVLSCDNLPHNGDIARAVLLAFARHQSEALAEWIQDNVTFPNSMVDRITPVTTPEHVTQLASQLDIEDSCPVVCEPFSMWVMEDNFCAGRPNWEAVGVTFTDNVIPFESMKLSLLNATHTAMAYLGIMGGFTYTYAVIENSAFRTFLQQFMDEDVTPILASVPGVDLTAYKAQLLERFGNRHCADPISRLCFDGSGKIPQFLVPSIDAMLREKMDLNRVALIVASWSYYLKTRSLEHIADPRAEELWHLAQQPDFFHRIIEKTDIFGNQLGKSPAFKTSYLYWLDSLEHNSIEAILDKVNLG